MAPLRVLLLGYGLSGRVLLAPVVGSVDGLAVTGVVTRDPERQAQARADLPGVRVHSDAVEALASGAYDTAVVATPNRTHVALATAALEAGVPVVVDKPLAATGDAAAALAALAAERGVLLAPYLNRRWDAELLTARAVAPRLGRLHRLELAWDRWRPEPRAGWRESADPADGGGVLLDLGTHLVDQAVQLLGPVTAVHAVVRALRPGALADDDALLTLRHAGGAVSRVATTALAADPAPRLRLLGDRGAYLHPRIDPQEAALRAGRRPGDDGYGAVPDADRGVLALGEDHREPVDAVPGDWSAFWRGWRDAIRGDGPPPVAPDEAVHVARVLDAARRSSAEDRVVPVAGG